MQVSTANSMRTGERDKNGNAKVERYKWTTRDDKGQLQWVNKNRLRVDSAYQRDVASMKVLAIARDWSWIACGAICVASRDGQLWVVDGQHRVAAAMKRSDIVDLPCIMFKTETQREEAEGFLVGNAQRKPVTTFQKFKAMAVAGMPDAMLVMEAIDQCGLAPSPMARSVGNIKCLALCLKLAKEDETRFRHSLALAASMSAADGLYVNERVLAVLFELDKRVEGGMFTNKRLVARVESVGAKGIIEAAARASAFYVRGGVGTWMRGVMEEVNRGLRNRFAFAGDA